MFQKGDYVVCGNNGICVFTEERSFVERAEGNRIG